MHSPRTSDPFVYDWNDVDLRAPVPLRGVTLPDVTLRDGLQNPPVVDPKLRDKLAANPADLQARFDLALALLAADDASGAIDALLEIVRRERKWNDEAARMQLLKIFDALGPTDARTAAGRRQLSSILFS